MCFPLFSMFFDAAEIGSEIVDVTYPMAPVHPSGAPVHLI